MDHLDERTQEELRDALAAVTRKTPAIRLFAAIAHKNGTTQSELAEWLDVERKTIYNWLKRIDEGESIVRSVTDRSRPGRPRKLTRSQLSQLEQDLARSPRALGYDEGDWRPTLLQKHIETAYAETYSLPSCRRLLAEFGD